MDEAIEEDDQAVTDLAVAIESEEAAAVTQEIAVKSASLGFGNIEVPPLDE